MVVFTFGLLPGERARVRVSQVRRRHAFAEVEELLQESPDRVSPPCPYFGRCGGCQLQHLAYPQQLQAKRMVLTRALERAGVAMPPEVELVSSPDQWRYRWRGEFHRAQGEPGLGFVQRSSTAVLGVVDCLIHHSTITQALGALARPLPELGPAVTNLQLTAGEGGELLVGPRPRSAAAALLAAADPHLLADVALTDEATSWIYRGRSFRIFPDSFVQVNRSTLEPLYEGVIAWLGPEVRGGHVIDAYGGLGMLSLRLADIAARVTVLESNPVAARLCQLHAQMHQLSRVEVVCGPVETELPRCDPAEAVVLDPPRAGLSPPVRGWLSLAGPRTLVYLSCEVSGLARDLGTLCRLGPYRLDQLRLVDMFPQTYHFESVALLRRA